MYFLYSYPLVAHDLRQLSSDVVMTAALSINRPELASAECYAAAVLKPGFWGGDLELNSLAKIVGRTIVVLSHPHEGRIRFDCAYGDYTDGPPAFLLMLNKDNDKARHYVPCVPVVSQYQVCVCVCVCVWCVCASCVLRVCFVCASCACFVRACFVIFVCLACVRLVCSVCLACAWCA